MPGQRNLFRGLSGGIFLIFLAIAFTVHGFFLPILFVGLAFAALFGSLSAGNSRASYGGLMGFVWMLGLACCFIFGFFPWILVFVGISVVLGTLFRPIMQGMEGSRWGGMTNGPQAPYAQQPYQPATPEQPYRQGYQPQAAPPEMYQEGGQQHPYPQQYEQPQAQYPQEMPPQQQ